MSAPPGRSYARCLYAFAAGRLEPSASSPARIASFHICHANDVVDSACWPLLIEVVRHGREEFPALSILSPLATHHEHPPV